MFTKFNYDKMLFIIFKLKIVKIYKCIALIYIIKFKFNLTFCNFKQW